MKDRLVPVLSHRLTPLPVIVLLVGTLWLTAQGTDRSSGSPPTTGDAFPSDHVSASWTRWQRAPGSLPETVAVEIPSPVLLLPAVGQLQEEGTSAAEDLPQPGPDREPAGPSRPLLFPDPSFDLWEQKAPEPPLGLHGLFGTDEEPQEVSPSVKLDLPPPPAVEEEEQPPSPPEENASRAELRNDEPPALDEDRGAEAVGLAPALTPAAPAPRSRHLELVAREADAHNRHGFELAGRGAYFSARAELTLAVRLVADALDAEHQTTKHARALAAGLTALKEAEDFMPTRSQVKADLDLAILLGGHRTPVLQDVPTDNLTPLTALQCYFRYAQEQLATAVGEEFAGSMALYGLGNLHRTLAAQRSSSLRGAGPKAVVFYQAAILACPHNHMAGNELGVLLARGGRYEEARVALEHSVLAYQHSTGWNNLAVVYRELGLPGLAEYADWQSQAARQAEAARRAEPPDDHGQQVQWVEPATFARSYADPAGAEISSVSGFPATDLQTEPAESVTKRFARLLPWISPN